MGHDSTDFDLAYKLEGPTSYANAGLLSTALFYEQRKIFDQALLTLDKVSTKSTQYPAALLQRSRINMRSGNYAAALQDIDIAKDTITTDVAKLGNGSKRKKSTVKFINIRSLTRQSSIDQASMSLLYKILIQRAKVLFHIGDFELALYSVFSALNLKRKKSRCAGSNDIINKSSNTPSLISTNSSQYTYNNRISIGNTRVTRADLGQSHIWGNRKISRKQNEIQNLDYTKRFWDMVPNNDGEAKRLIRMLRFAIISSFDQKHIDLLKSNQDSQCDLNAEGLKRSDKLPIALNFSETTRQQLLGREVFRVVKAFQNLLNNSSAADRDQHSGIYVSLHLKQELQNAVNYVMNTLPFWYHIQSKSDSKETLEWRKRRTLSDPCTPVETSRRFVEASSDDSIVRIRRILQNLERKCKQDPIKVLKSVHKLIGKYKLNVYGSNVDSHSTESDDISSSSMSKRMSPEVLFHLYMLLGTCLCSTGHTDAALVEFDRAHNVAMVVALAELKDSENAQSSVMIRNLLSCIHRASGCMLNSGRFRDVIALNERLLSEQRLSNALQANDHAIISYRNCLAYIGLSESSHNRYLLNVANVSAKECLLHAKLSNQPSILIAAYIAMFAVLKRLKCFRLAQANLQYALTISDEQGDTRLMHFITHMIDSFNRLNSDSNEDKNQEDETKVDNKSKTFVKQVNKCLAQKKNASLSKYYGHKQNYTDSAGLMRLK
ncbi:hypothetical protein GJ496_006757 [Pomphorhynchus laevis]|nr:hypothetical protein GJ496_006757 [Pomphorhynchus laevis]